MKTRVQLKKGALLILFIISPFLTIFTFNSSLFPFKDIDLINKSYNNNPFPINIPNLYQTNNDYVDGQGNNLNYRAEANVTGLTSKLLNTNSFLITTNVWNITYTSLNITNIQAYTINKFEETSNNTYIDTDTGELFARLFSVSNSCVLNNFSIFRSALANTTLNLTKGGTANVDYGPINITVMIWNATNETIYFKPDKLLKRFDFNNRKYGWATNGTPNHIEAPEIGWELFNTSDFYLNTENTKNNSFFISINTTKSTDTYDGKQISSHYRWYLQERDFGFPNTFNSTDGGLNWSHPSFPTPIYSMTLGVNISLASDTFYPSNISLKIKGSNVTDVATPNQGIWSSSGFYIYDGDDYEFYTVSLNWSPLHITFDITFNCSLNKSGSISSYYSANASKNYIDWNSTINVNPPNTRINNTVYIMFPLGWNSTSVSPAYSTSNYTKGQTKFLEIYNVSSGNIRTYFRSENLIVNLTIERYLGGTLYQEIGFTECIDETVRINASFSHDVATNLGTLSVFDFNGILNYTDQKAPINNIINFSNWDIDTTTKANGSYLIQVFWSNGTAVGINATYFHIIYPTKSTLLSPTSLQTFYGQSINVTLYFENDFSQNIYGETGIQKANVTAVFNSTDKYILTETYGAGYYNTMINTTGFENGTYGLNITIEKFGYLNKSYNLEIEIVYNTSLYANVTVLTIYYSEVFDIELNYNRTDFLFNIGINSSIIQVEINGTDATSYIQIDYSEENIGNYTLRLNTTNCSDLLLPGNNIIIFKFSKQGYYLRQVQVDLTVLSAITTLRNYTLIERQGGLEEFNITVYYNNTILNRGIVGANFTIYKDGRAITEVYSHTDVNNDTFCLYDFQNGTYNIELNITIGLNYTMQILIVSNKSGYLNGSDTVFQQIWVWETIVPRFIFSETVTYGQNQTIILDYNLTDGTGISPANIFSTWNDIGYYDEFITDHNNGTYTLTFDTNLTMAGNQTITVNSRRNGYQWNSTTITFRIAGYITNITTYNSSILAVFVNDSLFNIRLRYFNNSNNFNVSNANVYFQLKNSTNYLFDTEVTSSYISYENETDGEYNFTINTNPLHADLYNLKITIEFHNISVAFEYSSINFTINITRLPSILNTTLHVGDWWINTNTSIKWFEYENITINMIFKADFYDTGSPVQDNVTWGTLFYEIIKQGETTPAIQGQFINVGEGLYQATINLSMNIQSKTSENYIINITGTATDIQNATTSIDLNVRAKKDLTIIFLPMPEEIVENEIILIQALVLDSIGMPAHGETVIFNIYIIEKSGLYHQLKIPINTVGGVAIFYFQVPLNVQAVIIEASTQRSMASWASKSFYQPINPLPQTWVIVQFLRIAWPFITAIIIAAVALHYYQRKYKPKKIKQKEVRDTISYRFKSASNLIHLLVYDQKTSELLYVYSTPEIKLTTYLMNSILESNSMYDNMKLTRQEIYLRDDARLILHDGEYVRIAMVTRELPSVEMQKQLEHFTNEFELKFGRKIPEWRQDITRLARMIDMGFANDLIEECFEKSLIFPHNIVTPKEEEIELTRLEQKLFEIATKIRAKSGPFLLQRLIARGQTELAPQVSLLQILEGVYNLRKKGVIAPVSESEAQRLRDAIFRKEKAKKEPKDE
ncbi:MAG: hypothetical protein ACTSO9_02790 [Candidatus Helarchaeota archaeon]